MTTSKKKNPSTGATKVIATPLPPPPANAHEIVPGLYLGNEKASKDPKFFKDRKITAVLNMTHDLPCHFRSNKTIEYATVPVDDSLKQKDFKIMEESLPFAVAFIHKNLDLGKKNMLVHCYMGAQRSAAAVAAYLMKHRPQLGPSFAKTVKYIHSKRPIAWHNGEFVNFDQALKAYRKRHLSSSSSSTTSKKK